ncbi:MAG: hypothetical protein JSR82_23805 [Verrucomicrobia bacterium]|nr:hypothetical protein [Verrucomicrobiota bacterium]
MNPMNKADVVGQRVREVIVARSDKPVSMADQSSSSGYVYLENGVLIDLDAGEAMTSDRMPQKLEREHEHEKTFGPILGEKVSDLVVTDEFPGVCVVLESGCVIAIVPGLFWIAPFLHSRGSFPFVKAVSVWPP